MYDKEKAAYKLKVEKIMVNFNKGRLPDNSFFNSFMPRVFSKVERGIDLSEKEKEKVDEIFDTY